MDGAVWIAVAGAVVSVVGALVALRAARDAKRYRPTSAVVDEHATSAVETPDHVSLRNANHGAAEDFQPPWRFHRFATVTPTPIVSFSRWPLSAGGAEEERLLFDLQAREAHEQQLAQQRFLLPLACALVNNTGETAWGTEWACPYESFLNEDDRGPNRPPRDVPPNHSLLTFERRPPDNTEIVVTWYRRPDRAHGSRQHWRGLLPTE